MAADTQDWFDRMRLRPTRVRAFYLRQAALIGLALGAAVAVLVYVFEHDGSLVWLMAARHSRRGSLRARRDGDPAGSRRLCRFPEGLFVILAFGAMLVLIPALAPVFLVWTLVQASRAEPEGA